MKVGALHATVWACRQLHWKQCAIVPSRPQEACRHREASSHGPLPNSVPTDAHVPARRLATQSQTSCSASPPDSAGSRLHAAPTWKSDGADGACCVVLSSLTLRKRPLTRADLPKTWGRCGWDALRLREDVGVLGTSSGRFTVSRPVPLCAKRRVWSFGFARPARGAQGLLVRLLPGEPLGSVL